MTLEQLFRMIQGAGMIPVPVSREGETDEVLNYFEGSLDGFLGAAKAIGSTAVFVMETLLDEDHFYYRFEDALGDEDDAEEEGKVEEIDLASVLPSLSQYKARLGEAYSFFLMAKGGADNLCFFHHPDWVEDFEDEIEHAEGLAVLARRRKKNS